MRKQRRYKKFINERVSGKHVKEMIEKEKKKEEEKR